MVRILTIALLFTKNKLFPNMNKESKKNFLGYLLLSGIVVLSLACRIYLIQNQNILFYDEGVFLKQAASLYANLFEGSSVYTVIGHYDIRILWPLIIAYMQFFLKDPIVAGQCMSVLAGCLTVVLVFFLSKRMYNSFVIGMLGAVFLGFSGLHILFSRLILPDATAVLFSFLSVFCYIKAKEGGLRFFVFSGLMMALAFHFNNRSIQMMAFIFSFEIISFIQNKFRFELKRFFLFAGSFIVLFVLISLLKDWALGTRYLQSLGDYASVYSKVRNAFFLVYPFYILKFEGILACLLLVTSLFYFKKHFYQRVLVLTVVIQLLVLSLMNLRVPRGNLMVLPFIAILCGSTLFYLCTRITRKQLRHVVIGGVVLLKIIFIPGNIQLFHSDIKEAVAWINDNSKEGASGILTSVEPATSFYASRNQVLQLSRQSTDDLKRILRQGYGYILIDPHKFLVATESVRFLDVHLMPLVETIEDKCVPEVIFSNLRGAMLEEFFFEHNHGSHRFITGFIKSLDDEAGKIKIYKIKSCISKIADK